MAKDLTLEQVKKFKKDIESSMFHYLYDKIQSFEQKTGVEVMGISVNFLDNDLSTLNKRRKGGELIGVKMKCFWD